MKEHDNLKRIRQLEASGKLYVGFGSNLNRKDLAERTNGFRIHPISRCFVTDSRLVFDRKSQGRNGGVLSLETCQGAVTEAMLFDTDSWGELDIKEGMPSAYTRIPISVQLNVEGQFIEVIAQAYATTNPQGFVEPSEEYYKLVLEGFSDYHIDCQDLRSASKNWSSGTAILTNVFTYGTLARKECRASVMQSHQPAQVARADFLNGRLYSFANSSYPCLINGKSQAHSASVVGDLWSYNDYPRFQNLINKLDEIEGTRGQDIRTTVQLVQNELQNGGQIDDIIQRMSDRMRQDIEKSLFRLMVVPILFGSKDRLAWTYFYNRSVAGMSEIPSGNWRVHTGRWHELCYQIAQDFISRSGGLEELRTKRYWFLDDSISSIEEFTERLKTGDIEERRIAIRAK